MISQITSNSISTGAVTANSIANYSITGTQLANNTITGAQITNSTITATQIAPATITGGLIVPGTLTPSLHSAGVPVWDSFGNLAVGGNISVAGSMTVAGTTTIENVNISNTTIVTSELIMAPAVNTQVINAGTSNTLTLLTNNTTALTIDTSQNVGIGTTSPSNKVSIVTTSGSDGLLSITSPSTDTAGILINGGSSYNKGALVTLQKTGTTKWRIGLDSAIGGGTNNNLNIYGSSTDALVFSPNATEAARIDSSGNLGIGTSSPSSGGGGGLTLGTTSSGKSFHVYSSSYANNGLGNFYGTDGNMKLQMGALSSTSAFLYTNTGCSLVVYSGGSPTATFDTSNNLGLGVTPSGTWKFEVKTGTQYVASIYQSGSTGQGTKNAVLAFYDGTYYNTAGYWAHSHAWNVNGGGTQAMTLNSSGFLGIGATSPLSALHVSQTGPAQLIVNNPNSGYGSLMMFGDGGTFKQAIGHINTTNSLQFGYGGSATTNSWNGSIGMSLNSSGNLGIGTTGPSEKLHVNGNGIMSNIYPAANPSAYTTVSNMGFNGVLNWWNYAGDASTNAAGNVSYIPYIHWTSVQATYGYRHHTSIGTYRDGGSDWGSTMIAVGGNDNYPTTAFLFRYTGDFTAPGTVYGASKSFRIPHPHPEKSNTHNLMHASVEAPRMDLIYRGEVVLSNGTAQINIDTVSGMTEGTFINLCRNVQCFTTNESDWSHVKGKVNGNILTIQSQDTNSNSTISWMVIGERKDSMALSLSIMDDNGNFIVEKEQEHIDKSNHHHVMNAKKAVKEYVYTANTAS